MATIGHTLVGLTAASSCPRRYLTPRFAAVWLGVAILAAHLVDLVEWLLTIAWPARFAQHAVTHSPLLVAAILAGAMLTIFVFTRIKSALPYLLVAVAIVSHVLLDYFPLRIALLKAYGASFDEAGGIVPVGQSIVAELWAYGLLLVLLALFQASRVKDISRPARKTANVLAVLSLLAAATRLGAIWAPFYVLSLLHVILMKRRWINRSLAWSVVPMAPLLVLLALEGVAAKLFEQARDLQRQGRYAEAIALHHRAIAVPTRTNKEANYVYLSFCYLDRGELDSCFYALKKAERVAEAPIFSRMSLARFYMRGKVRGTKYDRPEEAAEIFREALEKHYPAAEMESARHYLAKIEERLGARAKSQ